MSEPRKLRLGLPKGSLQEDTQKLFALAGYQVRMSGRTYSPDIDDPEIECILIRAQEMARYVEQGVIDCGITGIDWVLETGADVVELADLEAPWPAYCRVRWVLAVKQGSPFRSVADLEGKRIAAEAVGLATSFFERQGVKAQVEFSWGATEVKPPILADAIVDVTVTGSGLRENQLEVLEVLLESTPRFIANREANQDPWRREKMSRLLMLLKGAIAAASRVGLGMNVPRDRLDKVLELLPALDTPTVSPLADERWVSVFTIVEEKRVRDLIPQLAEVGARGIIENPLNKIIN
ncbi:MAG: ATP phosphoribosyltransferase [Proteobacteria bacterium]|nr:ATP phosphoribosyltransferase [Pseudomonadota bacterium]